MNATLSYGSRLTKAAALEELHECLEIRRASGVRELSIFGSVARDDATDDSDVDLLVAFDQPPSFRRFMEIKFMLEDTVIDQAEQGL